MEETKRPLQEIIRLPTNQSSYQLSDYHITSCNKEAVNAAFAEKIGLVPFPKVLIIKGGKSSGKTFLAKIIAYKRKGVFVKAAGEIDNKASLYLIDNANSWDEPELFHAINIANELQINLIILTDIKWQPQLKDLASRINSIKSEIINHPDDELMEIIIVAEFSKRSLDINKDIISYLKTRLERNFKEILSTIDKIDKYCLKNKKNITIRAISEVMSFNE